MKSRASVTVMVTWVCVKESSNIQSGWREGKVNLYESKKKTEKCHSTTQLSTLLRLLIKIITEMCGAMLAVYLKR